MYTRRGNGSDELRFVEPEIPVAHFNRDAWESSWMNPKPWDKV